MSNEAALDGSFGLLSTMPSSNGAVGLASKDLDVVESAIAAA